MVRTRSLRPQSARHRVDHGTICGRSCANSGHYKPLCACVDRIFINPNSSGRRPENLELGDRGDGLSSPFVCAPLSSASRLTPSRGITVRPGLYPCAMRDFSRDRRLGVRRVSRVLLDVADEIERSVQRLVILRIRGRRTAEPVCSSPWALRCPRSEASPLVSVRALSSSGTSGAPRCRARCPSPGSSGRMG